MKNAHRVNTIFSIILILTGLTGFLLRYLEVKDFQFTALIPTFFGITLLLMNKGIKNQNKIIAHLAVLLTLLLLVISVIMLVKNLKSDEIVYRKIVIFSFLIITSTLTLISYVIRFISIRKENSRN